MKLIKRIWNNQIFRHLLIMGGIFFSFLVSDVFLRYFSNQHVSFYGWARSAPNLFTFSWICLIIGVLYLIPKKARMITYSILLVISNIIVYAEYLHFLVLKRFFTFSDLFLAGEGADYFSFAIGQTDLKILGVLFISFLAMGVSLFLIKITDDIKKNKYYYIVCVLIMLVLVGGFRFIATYKLGVAAESTTYTASHNAKNIYIDYNNQNKSLEVSGIYELTFRSAYIYIKDNYFSDKEEIALEVDNLLKDSNCELVENEYTGILEGKNVIYVLMETIDSWLVSEEVMPTLYNLQQTGLNFTNRYAPPFSGGQTINSEFAMNTGLYAVSNGKAVYNYDKNDFNTSLANKLKSIGYNTASIHTNNGGYYNRTNLHEALGYDVHYSLDNIKDINHTDYNYYNDSSLVKNDEVYNMIVREEPFLSFIISYSAHVPYDNTNDRCVSNPYDLNVDGNSELSCIRNLARETDEMLRILIEKLENDGLLEDTVLVLVSDHYAYGYEDQDYIKEIKGTDNQYLLQNVPFIIWSKDIKAKEIDTLMDTADILPTLFNMMNIDYNPNYYSGTDVFSESHEDFVYFSNDIFYDGETLYDGTNIKDDKKEYANEVISKINRKIKLNNSFILSDYFKNK